MGNNVVDILIKIKRVGEQEIKKTIAELKGIGGKADLAAPLQKSFAGLQAQIAKIGALMRAEIAKTRKLIEATTDAAAKQASKKVAETTNAVDASTVSALKSTIGITGAILLLEKVNFVPMLQRTAQILKGEYVNSINYIVQLVREFQFDIWGIFNTVTQATGRLVRMGLITSLIRANISAGLVIGRSMLGMGAEGYTVMERVSRVAVTIEKSMFVTGTYIQHIASSVAWAAGGAIAVATGVFPPMLTILPLVSSLFQAFRQLGLERRLAFMARLGSAQAQIQLIFLTIKKTLAAVAPVVSHYLPQIKGALNAYLSGLPKVDGMVTKIARGIFSIAKAPFAVAGATVRLLDKGMTKLSAIGSKTTVYPMRPQAAQTAAAATPGTAGKSNTITKMLSDEFSPERMQEILRRVFKVLYKGTKEEFAAYFAATKVDLQQLFLNFRKVAQEEALKTPRALGKVILQGLFAGATADKQAISKDVQKIFGGLAESLKAQGKNFRAVAQGFQSGAKTFNNEFKKAAGDGVEYYPQSPAKKGPLKNLISMGKKIPEQLAQGMNAGKGVIARVTGVIAETIAKFFPRSPALLGPLVYLVSMGLKIPFYLGVGIAKGAFHLLAAVGALVKKVVEVLGGIITKFNELSQKFGDLSRLAKRVDFSMPQITSLEYAFATVGESVTGLEFVLQSLNKSVATGFSDEDLAKILKLGVNLDAVRNSANPTLEILYQLADVLKNNAVTSKQYQTALELLQQTAGSKLVDVLAKGRDGLQELQREGIRAGAVLSDTTGAALQKYNELRSKLELLKNRYFTWAIDYFLPLLNSTLETLYTSTLANSNKIKAYVLYVYNILLQIGKLLITVYFDVMKDPGAALERIKNALVGLFNFAVDMANVNMDWMFAKVKTFITIAIRFLFESSISMLEFMMPSIWAGIAPVLTRIFEFLVRTAKEAGKILFATITGAPQAMIDDMVKEAQLQELMLENAARAATKTRREAAALLREAKRIEAQTGRTVTTDEAKEIQKKIESGEITVEASYFEELIDKFNAAWKDASTGFDFDAAKKTVMAKFQALLVGVVSPETRAQIEAQMEKINEAIDAKNIEKTIEELKKLDEQVEANATNVKNAGDKVVAGVEKTYARIPGVIEKASRDVTLALGRFAKKLAEGGNSQFGTGSEVETLELQARQEEELAGFKKLQEEKRDLAWGSLQSQHDKALFLMNEEKELKKFEAMQAAETAKAQADEWSKAWSKAVETVSASISNLGTMFDDLYEMSKESIKEFFYASKAAAIAQTIMKTAESVMSALAQGGPYLGPAMAATAAAMGTVQVAKITSQALGYEKGGLVTTGSGTKDDVPAMLSRGEFVIRNDAVKKLGKDYLERLNRGVQIPMPKFAAGGMVGSLSATTGNKGDSGQNAPVINIANIVDPQQVARYFASSEGKRAFVNMVSDNAPRVKAALGAR